MFTLKKATVSDYSSIQLLRHDFYKAMAEVVPMIHLEPDPQSSFFSKAKLQAELCSKEHAHFLAKDADTGASIGFVSLGKRSITGIPIFVQSAFANIDEIYVVKQFRGRGIARHLVDAAST